MPRAIGLQVFLLSTLICQVTVTVSSDFPCAMGMAMVGSIPFMHSLAQGIIVYQGTGIAAMSTTMVTFALSTIVMGCALWLAVGLRRLQVLNNMNGILCVGGECKALWL